MPVRPITAVAPVPRKIRLGDETVLAGEFRISDIATIQAWLDEQAENPLDAIRDEMRDLPRPAVRALLRKALDEVDRWPIVLGTEAAAERLASAEGVCLVIYLALARYTPQMTVERAVSLASQMTPGQYGTLCRIAYGNDTSGEIERLLGLHDEGPRVVMDWCRAIDEVSHVRHWTYDYIYSLTLSEFVNVRMSGKAPSRSIALRDGETFAEAADRVRRILEED